MVIVYFLLWAEVALAERSVAEGSNAIKSKLVEESDPVREAF